MIFWYNEDYIVLFCAILAIGGIVCDFRNPFKRKYTSSKSGVFNK